MQATPAHSLFEELVQKLTSEHVQLLSKLNSLEIENMLLKERVLVKGYPPQTHSDDTECCDSRGLGRRVEVHGPSENDFRKQSVDDIREAELRDLRCELRKAVLFENGPSNSSSDSSGDPVTDLDAATTFVPAVDASVKHSPTLVRGLHLPETLRCTPSSPTCPSPLKLPSPRCSDDSAICDCSSEDHWDRFVTTEDFSMSSVPEQGEEEERKTDQRFSHSTRGPPSTFISDSHNPSIFWRKSWAEPMRSWPNSQCTSMVKLKADASRSVRTFDSSVRRGSRLTSRVVSGEVTREDNFTKSFVMRPDSMLRIVWDIVSTVMVSYDVIRMPLDLVFSSSEAVASEVLDAIVTVFWTFDIPCSFATGFHSAGLVEMRPRKIARRYARSWLALDFIIVVADWTLFIIALHGGVEVVPFMRLGKTARIVRMLRAVRILRFAKFYRILSELFVHVKSEQSRGIFAILVMVTCIVLINHYIACGWIWLGTLTVCDGTWLENVDPAYGEAYQYATALHWSLTQFTPASMDVTATNILERTYSILVLLFGLVTFTSFVSSITSSMTHLRKIRSEPEKQEAILREYFSQNKVTAELGQRILNFLWANHFSIKKRLHEKDVPILALLPDFLRVKIREELHMSVIIRHPFLMRYSALNVAGVNELCHRGVEEVSLIAGDELFSTGSLASKMFFITGGVMNYKHTVPLLCCDVRNQDWACEPALWLKWVHVGRLVAQTTVEVSSLDASIFRETILKHEMHLDFVMAYRRLFIEMAPDSDICGDSKKLERLVRIAARECMYSCTTHLSSATNKVCDRLSSKTLSSFV